MGRSIYACSAVATILGGVALAAGCGPTGPATAPSAEFVNRLQNEEGCLDLVKTFQDIAAAKQVRFGMTDVIVPKDDAPYSKQYDELLYIVGAPDEDEEEKKQARDNEKNKKEFAEELSGSRQVGCTKIVSTDKNGKGYEAKIISATRTKIVIGPNPDSSDSRKDHFGPITFEIALDRTLRTSATSTFDIEHDCTGESALVTESHPVTYVSTIVWGDTASIPAPSDSLVAFRKQHPKPETPTMYGSGKDADDEAYCKAVGKWKPHAVPSTTVPGTIGPVAPVPAGTGPTGTGR